MQNHRFQSGDLVIYTMTKQSPHPGPRARSIHPSESGEDYSYVVDKFWMVAALINGQQLQLVTRKGKTRTVNVNDPLLRKASWWEKFRHRNRFPSEEILSTMTSADSSSSSTTDSVAAAP